MKKLFTPEQIATSRKFRRLAWRHFYPEGNGKAKPDYVLHHVDMSLRYIDKDRYVQWNIEDLQMMTNEEHSRLHCNARYARGIYPLTGKSSEELEEIADKKRATWDNHSDEWKNEFSKKSKARNLGEGNPMFGIPCTYKMSEEELQSWKNNVGASMVGLLYWNNGKENCRAKECPGDGWVRGRLCWNDEQKANLSAKRIGNFWWNNGKVCKFCKESPGDGWVRGRINRKG